MVIGNQNEIRFVDSQKKKKMLIVHNYYSRWEQLNITIFLLFIFREISLYCGLFPKYAENDCYLECLLAEASRYESGCK